MAAAQITTPKFFNLQHIMPVVCYANKATQADWIFLQGYPGGIPIQATYKAATTGANAAESTFSYGAATAGAATSAATSVAVTSAVIDRTGMTPFYAITPAGEIIMVTGDSAPTNASSTWTIMRGCLGTTAATITNTDVLGVLNCVILGAAAVGKGFFVFLPLPAEPKAKLVQQA
jgi:hypothetical protein